MKKRKKENVKMRHPTIRLGSLPPSAFKSGCTSAFSVGLKKGRKKEKKAT